MRYRDLYGVSVPILGQGTWNMERDDRNTAIAALRRGLDLGLTHVDTAELYGNGRVEELVGDAISGRRDDVFLVSKVVPENASRAGTLRACERSLRRLGTDHLDVYLLHWPGDHPLEGTISAFEQLVAEGKIRAWGVSNFDVADLDAADGIAPGKMACNQVLYHLRERGLEHGVLGWCRAHSVPIVGYSPFGSGDFPDDDPVLVDVAREHGATPRQIALAWLVHRDGTFAIPKTSTVAHVDENAGAVDVKLSADDLHRIDAAFPLDPYAGLSSI